jgi:hypothetical protein
MAEAAAPEVVEEDTFDLHNLALHCLKVDTSSLSEADLHSLTQKAATKLIRELYQLPATTERNDDYGRIVALPRNEVYTLPREFPAPAQRTIKTKWEQYKERKGLRTPKLKGSTVWDDTLKKWVKRFGYERVKDNNVKNWAIEVKDNFEQTTKTGDPFKDMEHGKKDRVAKNKVRQERNKKRIKTLQDERSRLATRSMGAFDK